MELFYYAQNILALLTRGFIFPMVIFIFQFPNPTWFNECLASKIEWGRDRLGTHTDLHENDRGNRPLHTFLKTLPVNALLREGHFQRFVAKQGFHDLPRIVFYIFQLEVIFFAQRRPFDFFLEAIL